MNAPHFTSQKPDLRSRKSMVDFLQGHFRYDTTSSWNRCTSYANKVKIHTLPLTQQQRDVAYEMLDVDDSLDFVDEHISQFTQDQNGAYTIGFNGRSSGYLVLYQSCYEQSEHRSRCTCCGQRNFMDPVDPKSIPEPERAIAQEVLTRGGIWNAATFLQQPAIQAIDLSDEVKTNLVNKWKAKSGHSTWGATCGVCHRETRVPYSARLLKTWPGRSIDQDEEFDPEEWSMSQLVARCRLVMAFDQTCENILNELRDITSTSHVETEVVMVPKEVRVLREGTQPSAS